MRFSFRALAIAGLLTLASQASIADETPLIDEMAPAEAGAEPSMQAKTRMSSFGQTGHVSVLRAEAHPSSRIELFAGSRGFVVGRTGAVYDLEGGASVHLVDRLSVTGSYRMIGYDLNATGTGDFSPQSSGPFVAVNVEF